MTFGAMNQPAQPHLRVRRELLDPNFEGYKLAPLAPGQVHESAAPSAPITFAFLDRHQAGASNPGFAMASARMAFNNLADLGQGQLAFLDQNWRLVVLDRQGAVHFAVPLTQSLSTLGVQATALVPAIVPVRHSDPAQPTTHVVVSDGVGSLHLVHLVSRSVVGVYTHPQPLAAADAAVFPASDDGAAAAAHVLAYWVSEEQLPAASSSAQQRARTVSQFHGVRLVFSLDLGDVMELDGVPALLEPLTAEPQWTTLSHPLYARLTGPDHAWVASNAPVRSGSGDLFEDTPVPSQAMDTDVVGNEPPSTVFACDQYSWVWQQTEQDVSVHVSFRGAPVEKRQIRCRFTRSGVHLVVDDLPVKAEDATTHRTVVVLDGKLWGTVDPDDCVWTLEANRHLTLHLEKGDPGTRWSSLLDESVSRTPVLETVDPSEVARFREQLEKYTADLAAPAALEGRAVPGPGPASILNGQEEIDLLVDEATLYLARCTRSGSGPAATVEPVSTGIHQFLCPAWPAGICLKSDVDGVLYTHAAESETDAPPALVHSATAHAFSYVQASKRDKRLAVATPQFTALAESRGHVYVYMPPPGGRDHRAPQHVLDLGSDEIVGLTPLRMAGGRAGGFAVLTETRMVSVVL
ncbi:hypothetical protein H9P43_002425 [Blastocladiella emersonii ATCC 22665]|nr:hypothetical protein H9P43_002425 [Blastocladiella emersonii ATCC 22665]